MTEDQHHHLAALVASRGGRFRPVADLLRGSVLPPPDLFKGFLLERSLTMLVSQPGVGKTWFLLYLMACGEMGLPLLGRFAPRGYIRSLLLALDSNPWDVAKQTMKLGRGLGLPLDLESHVQLRDKRVNLMDEGFVTWLLDYIKTSGTRLLMVDTMRKATHLNLNDDREGDIWMDQLDRIRSETMCSIIFTNHTRKVQAGFMENPLDSGMGSRVLTGGCDFVVLLQRAPHKEISLTMPKGREDFEWEELRYKLVHTGPPAARAATLLPVKTRAETYAALLAAMPPTPVTRLWLVARAQEIARISDEAAASKLVDNFTQYHRKEGTLSNPERGLWQRAV